MDGFDLEPLTLQEWLEQTEDIRAKLYAYAKTSLPLEVGERHVDFDRAVQNGDSAGRLVADADLYLAQEEAKEILKVKKEHEDLAAPERRAIVKSRISQLSHLRDALAVTRHTIDKRVFINQNENRAR